MDLYIACDHAGLPLKEHLIKKLSHINWKDLGTHSTDSVDYPDFADQVATHVNNESMGLLICGSGQGMAMRANKYPHIRAALCNTEELAQLSREHNNANVLCLGSRIISTELAEKILTTFLETNFEGGRHQRRVDKVSRPPL